MIPVPKPKVKSVSKLKKEVWKVFSQYIRLRDCLRTRGTTDCGNCITCGKLVRRQEADAGHFIDRRFNSTLFDERNVHLQCKHCNITGEVLKYRRAIIGLYGEGIDVELEDKATETKKFDYYELLDLKTHYQSEIKRLQEGVCTG